MWFHILEQNKEYDYPLPAKATRYVAPVLIDRHIEVSLLTPNFIID